MKDPFILKIPVSLLAKAKPILTLLVQSKTIKPSQVYRLLEVFDFRNDEKDFVKELLAKKKNYWVFRCHQQKFCGDFMIVDMSSPTLCNRKAYLIDLKQGASLKVGGGGAGVQFRQAELAILEMINTTQILDIHSHYQLVSGGKKEILAFLGVKQR